MNELSKAEMDIVRRIYHVDYHEAIEVGEDGDRFGMIEIRMLDDANGYKEHASVRLSQSSAVLTAKAILATVQDLKEKESR